MRLQAASLICVANPRVSCESLLPEAVASEPLFKKILGAVFWLQNGGAVLYNGCVTPSGSIVRGDFALALGTIRRVLQSFRIREGIHVVTGDTKGPAKRLCLSDPARIELTGGGDTDMAAIIEKVLDDRPRPQMLPVCTDG